MDSQVMNDALTNLDMFSPDRNAKAQEVIRDTESTSSETTLMRLKNVSSKSLQDNDGTNLGDDPPARIAMVESQVHGEANKKSRPPTENAMLTRSQKQKMEDVVKAKPRMSKVEKAKRNAAFRDEVRHWVMTRDTVTNPSMSRKFLAIQQAHIFIYGDDFDKYWKTSMLRGDDIRHKPGGT
jgi:hypothetical protein